MSEDRAQGLVVGCLAASAVIGAGNAIAEGHAPSARQLVGFSFVAVGLATASMFAPNLAGGMAALVLVSSVFLYSEPLYQAVSGVVGTSSTTSPSTPSTPTHTPTTRKV